MTDLLENSPKGARKLWIIGASAFLISAIAGAPASLVAALAVKQSPLLQIGASEGTLWRGSYSGVVYNRVPVGDIAYEVKPLGLLAGKVVIDASSVRGALQGKARLALSTGAVEFRNTKAQFDLGAIRQYTFFGARYQGVARIDAKSLRLSRTGCHTEEARVQTNAFDTLAKQLSGAEFPLAGDVQCLDGKLRLSLGGRNDQATVNIEVSLAPDLTYAMALKAAPKRPEISNALRVFGFEGDGDELSWNAVGRLRGLKS